MPRLLDTMGRTDTIVEAACQVIVRSGLPGLSLRAIATEARISPASLVHQFTDRERLIRVVVGKIGRRRVDDIGSRSWSEGGLAGYAG